MRSVGLLVLILFVSSTIFCQNTLSSIINRKEILTPFYEMSNAGCKVLYLPMEYGKSEFTNAQQENLQSLKNAIIARIDLVYSDYPQKADFSTLTRRRLDALQKLLPGVFLNKNIGFRKVRQTYGTTKDIASGMEHGFFIYYRELPTKETAREEIKKLKTSLGVSGLKVSLEDSILKVTVEDSSLYNWCGHTSISTDTTERPGLVTPPNHTKTTTKISIKSALSRELIDSAFVKDVEPGTDSIYIIDFKPIGGCPGIDYFSYFTEDSTVTQVFKRHNWSNSLIIADVTGSMYPYTGQLLKWIQLNLTDRKKRYFMFFNDGDDKEDSKKIIGNAGGIYSVFSNEYDEIEKIILKAMENGSGGDAPENNMEALLESGKVCASCDSIIMIADNWAPVKDMILLSGYHKPVKIVLCGVFDSINKDYLKLARDTKGSLHLIEEDIYSLAELKEGQTIKIHGVTYKLIDGNFVDLTPGSL